MLFLLAEIFVGLFSIIYLMLGTISASTNRLYFPKIAGTLGITCKIGNAIKWGIA
jgi:hypothetical protein